MLSTPVGAAVMVPSRRIGGEISAKSRVPIRERLMLSREAFDTWSKGLGGDEVLKRMRPLGSGR